MRLNELSPEVGSRSERKRVGRGPGSGLGRTAGRGFNGQKSRSGGSLHPGFEGGQMPLQRRVPKRGFRSLSRRRVAEVRLHELMRIEGEEIDLASLKAAGVINHNAIRAKVIASGTIDKAVVLKGVGTTAGARVAIEKAGGRVEA
ncbi:MAG: 50S ribosomal protein L15 [Acidiferrobacteraceae bacterium]|nr:50S ribosomal protein L15 [Acidiferrobacteraceae bacterium]